MPTSRKPCSTPGCPALVPTGTGRCPHHATQGDAARGTATARGYGHRHRTRFREGVLAREPFCRLCHAPSTDADHWPRSRRELELAGDDPDDPQHGRGLCGPCHSTETAKHQPGGWHVPAGGGG
jgi:5-methylcytosine-specific restriction protein A